ncbi:hypothetical protein AM1_3412 [Acaryochloris marina MBIC11017]|uniref:Uncharacterized protein n=1 Tax=Acaryochloris marina (strain MBIC 11017) TaxID=329726 RepID=B0C059_ACAM1|nr:hypothetical protein AM1_3412 [Acaryochloris marina MBIC11017]
MTIYIIKDTVSSMADCADISNELDGLGSARVIAVSGSQL